MTEFMVFTTCVVCLMPALICQYQLSAVTAAEAGRCCVFGCVCAGLCCAVLWLKRLMACSLWCVVPANRRGAEGPVTSDLPHANPNISGADSSHSSAQSQPLTGIDSQPAGTA